MKKKPLKFRVRVLSSDDEVKEIIIDNLTWDDAVDRFLYYVHSSLELKCSIRCVNIFLDKRCICIYHTNLNI